MARLLCRHPDVEIGSMTSRQNAGRRVSEVHPYLKGYVDIDFTEMIDDDCTRMVEMIPVPTPAMRCVVASAMNRRSSRPATA